MRAVPVDDGAASASLKAEVVAEATTPAEPESTASAESSATSMSSSWFMTAGMALWQLRLALLSGSLSATAHFAAVVALAVLHAPPPLYNRKPPPLPLEAVVLHEAQTVEVLPQFLEQPKLHIETVVPSNAPQDAIAKGSGSVGSGGGSGGGVSGGLQLAGLTVGPVNTTSGGTGFGTDDAFGTHMMGEVGELADPSATFFGVKADGRKFAFVVDTSGSMAQNNRYLRCRMELLRSLASMQYGQQYFVTFFNHTVFSMPEHKLVDARPSQLKKTQEWVVGAVPLGGTEPWPGLMLALRLQPDAIYLLTDGQFSEDVIEKVIRAQPETKKIPIHTIAFESPQGALLLERISRVTGGQHTFVP
jgi:hypothetical protein